MAPARRKGRPGRPKKGEAPGPGVVGVSPHNSGFRVKYVDRNGVERTTYRVKRAAAEEWAAHKHLELCGKPRKPDAIDVPAGRGIKREDWAALLWSTVAKCVMNPQDEEAQRVARTVAVSASAAAKHLDNAMRLLKITALEREVQRIRERQKAQVRNAEHSQRREPSGDSWSVPN